MYNNKETKNKVSQQLVKEQFGFKKNKGTSHATDVLRIISDILIKSNKILCIFLTEGESVTWAQQTLEILIE